MGEQADQFLTLMTKLEDPLRQLAGREHGDRPGFKVLVHEAADQHPAVRHFKNTLLNYQDLRNAIVHQRAGDDVIAEPHEEVVEQTQEIYDRIHNPPEADELCVGDVATCSTDDDLGPTIRRMRKRNFSQLPVLNGDDEIIDLLTTDTVTRWAADYLDDDDGVYLLEGSQVEEVLPFREDGRDYHVLGRRQPLHDVVEQFSHYQSQGIFLDAVIVTHAGGPASEPVGIFTWSDLPRIYDRLGLSLSDQ